MNQNTKVCPYCAEEIPANSIVCPNCGEKISQDLIDMKTIKIVFGVIVGIIILCVAGYFTYTYVDFADLVKKFQKPDRFLKKGITLYNEAKYEEALDFFEKQIEEDNNPMAYFYEGKVYEKQNNSSLAIKQYKKALKYKSDFDELKIPLVKLCLKNEDMDCVNEYIEGAYKQDKKDTQLIFYYASSIIKETDKSIPLLKEVADKEPDNYLANKYVGNYYYNKGEYKTALPYLKNSYNSKDKFKHDTGVEYAYEDLEDEGLLIASTYMTNDEYTNAIKFLDEIIGKTGNSKAKALKEEAVYARDNYNYQKEREKTQAAARREQDAYNKSRQEYYKELQKNNTQSNSSEPDFGPYMRELQRRIKNNWDPPKGNESKRVVVLLRIAKDGRLLSCSIFKSSGLPNVDNAAINAVKLAAPFRPLPYEYKGQNIDIQFTFDYNISSGTKYDL